MHDVGLEGGDPLARATCQDRNRQIGGPGPRKYRNPQDVHVLHRCRRIAWRDRKHEMSARDQFTAQRLDALRHATDARREAVGEHEDFHSSCRAAMAVRILASSDDTVLDGRHRSTRSRDGTPWRRAPSGRPGVGVIFGAILLAPPHDPPSGQSAARLGDDSDLLLQTRAMVEVEQHPVADTPEVMRQCRVRLEQREVPVPATQMQHG